MYRYGNLLDLGLKPNCLPPPTTPRTSKCEHSAAYSQLTL